MRQFKYFNLFLLPLFVVACSSPTKNVQYPDHWWQKVPKSEGKSWEILPQAAMSGEVILSKRNELGLMSNFAATPFEIDGSKYASLEGFWQSMKYPEEKDDPRWGTPKDSLDWKYNRNQVRNMVAFDAYRAGQLAEVNMKKLGIRWISYQAERIEYKGKDQKRHFELIVKATKAKIAQNPKVKTVLLSTGNLVLRPDHHQSKDATPAYRYFEIYMNLRTELSKAKE